MPRSWPTTPTAPTRTATATAPTSRAPLAPAAMAWPRRRCSMPSRSWALTALAPRMSHPRFNNPPDRFVPWYADRGSQQLWRHRRHELCRQRREEPELPQRHRCQHVAGRRLLGQHQQRGRGHRQRGRVPGRRRGQRQRQRRQLLARLGGIGLHRRRHRQERRQGQLLQLRRRRRHPGSRHQHPEHLDRQLHCYCRHLSVPLVPQKKKNCRRNADMP